MSKQAYYEGVEVTIRGEKYIFPGLSLAQLEENIFQYILAESGFEQGAPGSGEAVPAASA